VAAPKRESDAKATDLYMMLEMGGDVDGEALISGEAITYICAIESPKDAYLVRKQFRDFDMSNHSVATHDTQGFRGFSGTSTK
jgi:hypothetical protein